MRNGALAQGARAICVGFLVGGWWWVRSTRGWGDQLRGSARAVGPSIGFARGGGCKLNDWAVAGWA